MTGMPRYSRQASATWTMLILLKRCVSATLKMYTFCNITCGYSDQKKPLNFMHNNESFIVLGWKEMTTAFLYAAYSKKPLSPLLLSK